MPGARIGDYRIERELRTEDTGLVYLAQHVVLPRQAIVKVMHGGQMWLREMAIQVVREACVLEPLDHPGIPRVYECGVLADKRPWIALESLEGVAVSASLDDGHVMPVDDIISMLRDVSEILEYIHDLDVVHRNITASTVARRANAKFPFALRSWSEAHTPEIELPPGLVDPRDDIHALGTIAFRALTGDIAAPGKAAGGRRAGAPTELAHLIDQMLADDREDRPSARVVRERAAMIAAMTALVPSLGAIGGPRWTPVYGTEPSQIPGMGIGGGPVRAPSPVVVGASNANTDDDVAISQTTTSEFSIRIRR